MLEIGIAPTATLLLLPYSHSHSCSHFHSLPMPLPPPRSPLASLLFLLLLLLLLVGFFARGWEQKRRRSCCTTTTTTTTTTIQAFYIYIYILVATSCHLTATDSDLACREGSLEALLRSKSHKAKPLAVTLPMTQQDQSKSRALSTHAMRHKTCQHPDP